MANCNGILDNGLVSLSGYFPQSPRGCLRASDRHFSQNQADGKRYTLEGHQQRDRRKVLQGSIVLALQMGRSIVRIDNTTGYRICKEIFTSALAMSACSFIARLSTTDKGPRPPTCIRPALCPRASFAQIRTPA